MIDSIAGTLTYKSPTAAIIDVGGIRLRIHITLSTYERLPSTHSSVELLTYFHVREDIMDLYGFDSHDQRDLFQLLISISGIGPRSAITILSGANVAEFKRRIVAGDAKSLTVIPGIGAKTAKRIILELKEKFVTETEEDISGLTDTDDLPSDDIQDAIQALLNLGYKRSQAHQAMKKLKASGDLEGGLESILKKALTKM